MNGQVTDPGVPVRWVRLCQVLLAAGIITFAVALATGQAQRAWQAYLLNFLFWTGIAQCGVIFSAAYRVSRGQWSDTLRRMGESLWFFLPVSIALFVLMMLFGAKSVYSWARAPAAGKEVWLNVSFVTLRDAMVLLVLLGLSWGYIYYSRRWAPLLLIAFGVGYSLLGFDLLMSVDPRWFNTLFGWYFFVGAFYAMLALLAVSGFVFRRAWGLEHHLTANQTHDLGKLLFGFCLLTGGFFWSQWLVFWYGDLPEEIRPILHRFYEMPWAPFAWTMIYGGFAAPLVILLSKPLKRDAKKLAAVAVWILAMMWLERYVWIVPSVWQGAGAPLVVELLITAGFAGGFVWGWISYIRRFPINAALH
jgi:hypothetical protein